MPALFAWAFFLVLAGLISQFIVQAQSIEKYGKTKILKRWPG
jgi:hypothetical protein